MSAGIVSKWDHGSYEESVIQDDFVANMHDGEIKRKLLKETRTPQKALELAINVEMGTPNKLNISGTPAHTVLK